MVVIGRIGGRLSVRVEGRADGEGDGVAGRAQAPSATDSTS